MLMLILQALAEYTKDNFQSIYIPDLFQAAGFFPAAFFLTTNSSYLCVRVIIFATFVTALKTGIS
jgi:hypothetical protein